MSEYIKQLDELMKVAEYRKKEIFQRDGYKIYSYEIEIRVKEDE